MAPLGLTPFRAALALEIAGNISSLPSLLLFPDIALGIMTNSPAQTTPATRALTQMFGGIVAALTIPLILSWPTPKPGSAGEQQRGFRKASYLVQGAGEVFLGSIFASLYLSGSDCGFSQKALLGGSFNMFALLGLRWVFLVWKPHLIDEKGVGEGNGKNQ